MYAAVRMDLERNTLNLNKLFRNCIIQREGDEYKERTKSRRPKARWSAQPDYISRYVSLTGFQRESYIEPPPYPVSIGSSAIRELRTQLKCRKREEKEDRTFAKLMRQNTAKADAELPKTLVNEGVSERQDDPKEHPASPEESTDDLSNIADRTADVTINDVQASGVPIQLTSARAEPNVQKIDAGIQVEGLKLDTCERHLVDVEVQTEAPAPTVILRTITISELAKLIGISANNNNTSICITSEAVDNSPGTATSTNDSIGGEVEAVEHVGESGNADQDHIANEEGVAVGNLAEEASQEVVAKADDTQNVYQSANAGPHRTLGEESSAGIEVEDLEEVSQEAVGKSEDREDANGLVETGQDVNLGGEDRVGVEAEEIAEEASAEVVVGTAEPKLLSLQEMQEAPLAAAGGLGAASATASHVEDVEATDSMQVIVQLRAMVAELQAENNVLQTADRDPGAIQYMVYHCNGCTCAPEGTGQASFRSESEMDTYAIDIDGESSQPYARHPNGSVLGDDHDSFQGSQYQTTLLEPRHNGNFDQMAPPSFGNGSINTSFDIPQATYTYGDASSMSWNATSQTQQPFLQPDVLGDATVGQNDMDMYTAHLSAESMSSNVTSLEGHLDQTQDMAYTADLVTQWPPTVHTLTEIDMAQFMSSLANNIPRLEGMFVNASQGPGNHTDVNNQSNINGQFAQDNSAIYSGPSPSFGGDDGSDNRPATMDEVESLWNSEHTVQADQSSTSFVQDGYIFQQNFTSYTLAGALGPATSDNGITHSDRVCATAEPPQGEHASPDDGSIRDSRIAPHASSSGEVSGVGDAGGNHRGGLWDAAGRAFNNLNDSAQVNIRMKFMDEHFLKHDVAGPFLKLKEPFNWAAAEEILRDVDEKWINEVRCMLLVGANDEDAKLLVDAWTHSSGITAGPSSSIGGNPHSEQIPMTAPISCAFGQFSSLRTSGQYLDPAAASVSSTFPGSETGALEEAPVNSHQPSQWSSASPPSRMVSVAYDESQDISEESFASGSSLSSSRTIIEDGWLSQEDAIEKFSQDARGVWGQHDNLPTQPQPM